MNEVFSSTSSHTQTFRVRDPLPLMRPAFFASIAAVIICFLVLEAEIRWIILILVGVMVFSLGIAYWLMTRTRLEISSEGITYHAIGYRVRSTWGNLEGCATRLQGALDLECLILREPGMELSGWMRLGYQWLPLMNVISVLSGPSYQPNELYRYEGVIPVEMFDKNWRSGEIGRLIKQYAPQAYENAMR